jgi:DNA adenine methylase
MSTTDTPLRYPGGKSALAGFLARLAYATGLRDPFYVEPYCGGSGAAVSLLLNEVVSDIFLNDIDRGIYCFWKAVLVHTDELCERIETVTLSVSEWQQQRKILRLCNRHSILDVGFACLFLNRVNRSGVLSANPIGGIGQDGEWRMDARFNRAGLISKIRRIAQYRNRIHVSNCDALVFLKRKAAVLTRQSLVYLDPPYFVKGRCLYRNHYRPEDHQRLAEYLKSGALRYWLVSYDTAPEINALYSGMRRLTYQLSYTAARRYKGLETVFFSPAIRLPTDVDPFLGSRFRVWDGQLFANNV